jgi:hypothetical protein
MLLNLTFDSLVRRGWQHRLIILSIGLDRRCDTLTVLLLETTIFRAVIKGFTTLNRITVEHGSLGIVV